MTDRITQANLEAVCKRINRTVNGTDGAEVWTRWPNGLQANIGVYYIDGAYGGVALYRITNEHGGVTDVFNVGHVPKRELYHLMFAYLEGIEQATREPVTS